MVDREAVRDMALHLTLLDWQFLSNISRVRVLHCTVLLLPWSWPDTL